MDFLEFQSFVETDDLLVSHIRRHFSSPIQRERKGGRICSNQGKVLLIKKGTLALRYNNRHRDVICQLYSKDAFVYSTILNDERFYLESLENIEYVEFSLDEFSLQLEEDQLFSHFLATILSSEEQAMKNRLILETEKLENRLFYAIEMIFENLYGHKMEEAEETIYVLPAWLKIKTLASFANASVVAVSRNLQGFSKKGLIETKTTIWKVNIKKWMEESPFSNST
ncbi:hypothetical protein ACRW9N_02080 [Listeria aquatica]|uniref:hypothetical protein n=1 Tax=Listeria aquatica TaxID=1494960 RepID=UPI003EF6F773